MCSYLLRVQAAEPASPSASAASAASAIAVAATRTISAAAPSATAELAAIPQLAAELPARDPTSTPACVASLASLATPDCDAATVGRFLALVVRGLPSN